MKKFNPAPRATLVALGALAVAFLIVTCTGHANSRPSPVHFVFTTLDFPGAVATTASGINSSASPLIVGDYTDTNGVMHGYLRTSRGTYRSYDYPGSIATSFWGINDKGNAVGYWIDSNGNFHGLLFNGSTFTSIDYPGAAFTIAYDINNSGQVVGTWVDSTGQIQHGFSVAQNVYTDLAYPSSASTLASGINSSGNITGEWFDTSGNIHGFTLSSAIGGTYTTVDAPGATWTSLYKINDLMRVSGITYDVSGNISGLAAVPILNQFVPLNYPTGSTTVVRGINNTPVYVGHYHDSSGNQHGFYAAQTPK